jgi:hypothetical protein
VRERVTGVITHFKLPPTQTLPFMKANKVIWSGSVALEIAHPGSAVPMDLDLYVPKGTIGVTHDFLSRHTSYERIDERGGLQGFEEPEYTGLPFDTGIFERIHRSPMLT